MFFADLKSCFSDYPFLKNFLYYYEYYWLPYSYFDYYNDEHVIRTNNAVESFNHFLFLWFGIHPLPGVFIKLLIDLEFILRKDRI